MRLLYLSILVLALVAVSQCAVIDTVTTNVIKWLFSYFPKKQVKALLNSASTLICDGKMTLTEIERDLATQAITEATQKQLVEIQGTLTNATEILGGTTYQADIGIFFDAIFGPYLNQTLTYAEDYPKPKVCKTNVIAQFNKALTKASASTNIHAALKALNKTDACKKLIPYLDTYIPFKIHAITETNCA